MKWIKLHAMIRKFAHVETPEPLIKGDIGGQDHESLKEEHQEKNSFEEQRTETPMTRKRLS